MQAVAVVVCAGTGVRARAAGARAASGGAHDAGDAGAGGGSVVHVGEIHTAAHFVRAFARGILVGTGVVVAAAGIARVIFAVATAFGYGAAGEKAALFFFGPVLAEGIAGITRGWCNYQLCFTSYP